MGAVIFGPGIFEAVAICMYRIYEIHQQYVPPPLVYTNLILL